MMHNNETPSVQTDFGVYKVKDQKPPIVGLVGYNNSRIPPRKPPAFVHS
jgi:hypothetical protein